MIGWTPTPPEEAGKPVAADGDKEGLIYPLELARPHTILRVQLKGSNVPEWFGGFRTMLPDDDEVEEFDNFFDVLNEAHSMMGPIEGETTFYDITPDDEDDDNDDDEPQEKIKDTPAEPPK
ncbi:uncharacterized protein LOC113378353 [Ctenocephalides felis]|uniref:uncharacterized protein LOC113378353 n=1 Tax=Ctenocephalides felis TaxID=7515 RepID=UPI000E6E2A5D|nr:uncharacterized protein LOC113378353 [Ctenocephalides felis]